MLGWEHPELFHELPCEYNVQVYLDIDGSEEGKARDKKMVDPPYRNCNTAPKIVHINGLIP